MTYRQATTTKTRFLIPILRLYLLLAVTLLGITACGGSDDSPDPVPNAQRGDLVSVTSEATANKAEIDLIIEALRLTGANISTPQGTYGVALSSIVYKTITPDGRLINASGMVAYPLKFNNSPSPVLSFQHATIFLDEDAPTRSDNMADILKAIAGSGYIIIMADYIGYGSSVNEVHTYVHAQGLAAATIDMIRASRSLLARDNIATNGQLFLTGYSEGGYATLATQKEMEQNLSSEFTITASMAGAGPYDMSSSAQYMVGQMTNNSPQYLGFVFKSYDHWFGWNRINDIYQSPYDSVIANYFDGTNSGSAIAGMLTETTADLFQATFRSAFLGAGETGLKADIAQNDIYDWQSNVPTRLFHGVDDDIVPYANATAAETAMSAAGSSDVALIDCSTPSILIPADHTNCVPDYLNEVTAWFAGIANDL